MTVTRRTEATGDVLERLGAPPGQGLTPLQTAPLVIGSDRSCGLALSGDAAVAPRHCRIVREGSAYILQDLGSPAGTFINGERAHSRFLRSGDILQVGSSRFRFVRQALSAPTKDQPLLPVGPLVVLAVVALAVVALLFATRPGAVQRLKPGMTTVLIPPPPAPAEPVTGGATPSGPLPDAPSSSGMFTERPWEQEWPLVHVTHDSGYSTLTLRGQDGRTYSISFGVGSPGDLSVPPGDYDVEIRSHDPEIGPNYGEAVFRRYRRYEAAFTHAPAWMSEPLRLGDL
jgi:pSer/pThr/pTyr-binding forkhead associated (FHA) protein